MLRNTEFRGGREKFHVLRSDFGISSLSCCNLSEICVGGSAQSSFLEPEYHVIPRSRITS